MKQINLIISGQVQGVWFRSSTVDAAKDIGDITGIVRNLSSGEVEVIAEGPEDKLEKLIKFCKKGPSGAKVEDVKIEYKEATGEFEGFSQG
ncbi:acylphosphatase [Nanoarchaeota archaeon]